MGVHNTICLRLLNNYFHVDSDMSLAVSTTMPYCPNLTFKDDSTYKHAKDKSDCNSFLLPVLSKYSRYLVEDFILISIS